MEYRKHEIRAGAFILISFAILVVMLVSVSDLQGLFRRKKGYKVLVAATEGIEKNANVRYAGIRVGYVQGIRIVPELGGKVELDLEVYQDTVIKEDATAAIKTLGLVGRKYVEIMGGSPDAKELAPGGVLRTEESLKMEDLTRTGLEVVAKLKAVAQSIEKIVQNVERTVGDPALAKNVKSSVQNLNDITANVKAMTSDEGKLAESLKNLPEVVKKIDASVANLKEVLERTDKLVAENRQNIDKTLENVEGLTRNLKDASEDVKKNPWKLLRKP